MRVGDLSSREVYTVEPDVPLVEAVREMHRRHVGAVVVAERRHDSLRAVGIVTDRDVIRGEITRRTDIFSLVVSDVMSANLLVLPESCGLSEAISALRQWGVRRAPVVDDQGDLCGIITLDDLLPAVALELEGLAKLIGRQARREQ